MTKKGQQKTKANANTNTEEVEDQAANSEQTTTAEKRGTSRTLYFANSDDIKTLINCLKSYPRANLSSVFGQVVQPLNAELAKLKKGQRSIDLAVKIWL